MKTAIRTCAPVFNTYRMVQEYTDRFYVPCSERRYAMRAEGRKHTVELAAWKERVRSAWPQVSIKDIVGGDTEGLSVGSRLPVSATVHLGSLSPDDVCVEVYYGPLDPDGEVHHGRASEMKFTKALDSGFARYDGELVCTETGQMAFAVRCLPSHPNLYQKHEMALIRWA